MDQRAWEQRGEDTGSFLGQNIKTKTKQKFRLYLAMRIEAAGWVKKGRGERGEGYDTADGGREAKRGSRP